MKSYVDVCYFRIADNLPVATRLEFYPNRETRGDEEQKKVADKDVQFEHGYRLGFFDNNKVDFTLASSEAAFASSLTK